MRPARWNSLITFETASRVETIMFARSWCVRRTFRTVPDPSVSPKRSPRFRSNVASRAETSRLRRLSITSSDCLRRSEKEKNSFVAKSGWRFMTSLRGRFPHPYQPDVGNRLGEGVLARRLVEGELPEDAPVLQQRDRGFLVFAVDLVQAHGTF